MAKKKHGSSKQLKPKTESAAAEEPIDLDRIFGDVARPNGVPETPNAVGRDFGSGPGLFCGAGSEEAFVKKDGTTSYKFTPVRGGFVDFLDWSPATVAGELKGLEGTCVWFSGNTWVPVAQARGGRTKVGWRSKEGWQGSWAIVLDFDTGGHATLPRKTAKKLAAAAKKGRLPGHLFYLTPAGFRVIVLLERFCSEPTMHLQLHDALKSVTAKALHELGVDEVAYDKSSSDKARIFYAPNAFAKGVQRQADVIVMSDDMSMAEKLQVQRDELSAVMLEEEANADEAAPDLVYVETSDGIVWNRPTKDGVIPTLITNFVARVVRDVVVDDGAETHRHFEIHASKNGANFSFRVPSSQLGNVHRWAPEHLGAQAVVFPGYNAEAHAKTAIQILSKGIEHHRVFQHTGWTKMGGKLVYLHAGGGIGPNGPVSGVEVSLPGVLKKLVLPAPPVGAELRDAIRASMALRNVTRTYIGWILMMLPYRAALGRCDATPYLDGPTGAGKSELAALVMQHFGAQLDRNALPANWNDTANAIGAVAFYAKDALIVIDDFVPKGNFVSRNELERKADTVLRAQGNSQGRGRANTDGSLREERPPRGTGLSTGEDAPQGESIRARLAIMTLSGKLGDATADVLAAVLTSLQAAAREGLLAASLAGYVQWLAAGARLEEMRSRIAELKRHWRTRFKGAHSRTPDTLAELELGLVALLEFAGSFDAISVEESVALREAGRRALWSLGLAQQAYLVSADPAAVFVSLLSGALASGRCHLRCARTLLAPAIDAEAWGWMRQGVGPIPKGDLIGWLAGKEVYLEPNEAIRLAMKLAANTGDTLDVSKRSLGRILKQRDYLTRTDKGRTDAKVRLKERRPRVWIISTERFLDEAGPLGPVTLEADFTEQEVGVQAPEPTGAARPRLDEGTRRSVRQSLGFSAEPATRVKPIPEAHSSVAPEAPAPEGSLAAGLLSFADLKKKQSSKVKTAVARYNEHHQRDWGKGGSESCPVCGHNGCFGSLPDIPERWHCFSTDHENHVGADGKPVGLQGEAGWHGDALDVDAFTEKLTRKAHLEKTGFLKPAKPKRSKSDGRKGKTRITPAGGTPQQLTQAGDELKRRLNAGANLSARQQEDGSTEEAPEATGTDPT
ncbi:MAG: hypothetical protein R3E76_03920 [Planctomycetota bacterium]